MSRMSARAEAVMLIDEAHGFSDLVPDSSERQRLYDAAERLIAEWYEATAEEIDAASRASAAAEELRDLGIEIENR